MAPISQMLNSHHALVTCSVLRAPPPAEAVETDRREEAEANCAVDAVEVEAVVHRGVRALYTDNAEFFARFDGVGIASDCTRTGSVARHVGLYIH